MKNYVKEIVELNSNNVHIKNIDKVNRTIQDLIDGGLNKLQIVSDFDKTITKQHENGRIHMSSFAMFGYCPSVTREHKEITSALVRKYAPIETDPTMPIPEKIKHMEEWWSLSERALKGLKVSPKEIEEVCIDLAPSLRNGTKEFFDELHNADIPVLVFSAGLGDIVVSVLKNCSVLLPNVEVVTNFLKYDDKGCIMGFKDNIIHVYNKNEYAIKGTDFYNRILDRDNVILLGDSIGDAKMAEGIEHLKSILKIGFLYERSEESLPNYMDTFDIVLQDDQTMNVPRAILNTVKTCHVQIVELGTK